MRKYKRIILGLMTVLITSCSGVTGVYYLNKYNAEKVNTIIVLNEDNTYLYVNRFPPLGFYHRIYNRGTYIKKGKKIILNSFKQLKNDTFFSVKESVDSTIGDSLKFIIHNPSYENEMYFQSNVSARIFVNNKYEIGGFKFNSETTVKTNKVKEEVNYLDIELLGVMYKRYFIHNKKTNVFEMTFNRNDKLDSLSNIRHSYFDNETLIIDNKSEHKLVMMNGAILTKDKCKECDTSNVFKHNFLEGIR